MTGTNKNFNVKKLLRSILAIVMIATLVLGCVACSKTGDNGGNAGNNNNKEDNASKYEGLTDVEYAQALTLDQLEGAVDALASGIGAYKNLSNISTKDFGATAELTLTLGDLISDTLEQAIFGTADSGMDMSFLSNIGLNMGIDSTADLTQLQLALGFSDTEIVKLLLLADDETIWAGAPDLNESFLEVGMDDLGIVPNAATPLALEGVLGVLPTEEKLAEILNRYLTLALKEIETVERASETLELEGLKQDATKLTIEIFEQDALDAVKAVLTAAKADQDIKKIADDFGKFYNDMMAEMNAEYDMTWEKVDAYAEFTKGIDDMLADLPAAAEDTENPISLILYVDANHNVIGCSLTIPEETEAVVSYYTVTEGSNFKSIAEMPDDTVFTGAGTTNNGVITGNYTISVEGTPVIKFELVDFDATKEDTISGTVRLDLGLMLETIFMASKVGPMDNTVTAAPTAETQASGDIFDMLGVEDVVLELKLDITNDKESIEVKLLGDNALVVGLALKLATKTPDTIQKPTNVIELTGQQSVVDLLSGMDFTSVFENLRDAGVPEALVNALETLVPAA
ncbi:MAG: hypothetical protein IJ388_02645 [Oscillospiraceae bacterium]|nr:hypothetical protein [Oscillospiraceae bacterium]